MQFSPLPRFFLTCSNFKQHWWIFFFIIFFTQTRSGFSPHPGSEDEAQPVALSSSAPLLLFPGVRTLWPCVPRLPAHFQLSSYLINLSHVFIRWQLAFMCQPGFHLDDKHGAMCEQGQRNGNTSPFCFCGTVSPSDPQIPTAPRAGCSSALAAGLILEKSRALLPK